MSQPNVPDGLLSQVLPARPVSYRMCTGRPVRAHDLRPRCASRQQHLVDAAAGRDCWYRPRRQTHAQAWFKATTAAASSCCLSDFATVRVGKLAVPQQSDSRIRVISPPAINSPFAAGHKICRSASAGIASGRNKLGVTRRAGPGALSRDEGRRSNSGAGRSPGAALPAVRQLSLRCHLQQPQGRRPRRMR
jgi:hypothetical protein